MGLGFDLWYNHLGITKFSHKFKMFFILGRKAKHNGKDFDLHLSQGGFGLVDGVFGM